MSGRNDTARYAITSALLDGYSVIALVFRAVGKEESELIEIFGWSHKLRNTDAIEEFESLCSRHNAETKRLEYSNGSLTIILYA